MDRTFVVLGSISAFISVAAGAFGAHGLRQRISPEMLLTFETAARYQMYHALALLAVAVAVERFPGTLVRISGWCFAGGTILFSGSLYTLALSGVRSLGAITPLGGMGFLIGWIALVWGVCRSGN